MKRIPLFIAALFLIIAANAQENKPEAGKTGLGFSMTNGLGNRISLSHYLATGLEAGIQLGLNQSKSNNSQTDSLNITTTSGTKRGIQNVTTTSQAMTATVVPFILKHAPLESNIDAFLGVQVPITFGTTNKTTSKTETTTTDFLRLTDLETNNPGSTSIGVNLVFGCQWFFYKNLGLGAICGLGISTTSQKGDMTTTQTTTNSGTANPSNTNTTTKTISIRNFKSSGISTFNGMDKETL